jgi:hypothetical protein
MQINKIQLIYIIITIIILILIFIYYIINRPPTFHILIATGGRNTLCNMLNSLKNELTNTDAITIVFDGDNAKAKSEISPEWFIGHKAHINIIEQSPNLGFWGHGIRNKYQNILYPKCTFIMHADDDDEYIPGSFDKLRKLCIDSKTLYIARMQRISKKDDIPVDIIPAINKSKLIELGNIGTPNGIIPTEIAQKGEWGNFYGGDWHYYNGVKDFANNIVFLDVIIYTVNL